jgi:hypothetical protein
VKTLTPDDFKFRLMERAHMLRRQAIARSAGHQLDPKTTMWVIRREAWREFLMSQDYLEHMQSCKEKKLLDLPVRVTVDDDPDTPMVQLVMEPLLEARR